VRIPTTIFRFFSAYGPWGRPDVALFKFVQNILAGPSIDVYNSGNMERDFTYVDDLVEAFARLCHEIPPSGGRDGRERHRLGEPCGPAPRGEYRRWISRRPAHVHRGDRSGTRAASHTELHGDAARRCSQTEASTALLDALIGYRPQPPVSVGVRQFVSWYRDYYGI
jgi:UDP-glucuronate 4-epimerase